MNLEELMLIAEPIPFSGCFVLTMKGDKHGYVRFRENKKEIYAHRLSYRLSKGEIPKGFSICHHCDTPSCINPNHLFAGTHKQNMHDMAKKGRGGYPPGIGSLLIGERHGMARLKESDINPIRKSALTNTELAKEYKVNRQTIRDVRQFITWKHVPMY
ncbi:HNH endonuclease signature motif containing protein [Glaciimonas sp. PCH181]|uniref:HNH endonuclease signature motif containing protein n=1 Tax=Glaciimonas sp. PCH181 TaxID=2133943 RepID=UPI000D3BC1EE|nr:HNH endonuclease signature motif containing protein [Glaciimonas sp. PCH181]PUA19611.1 HNH endonuclease [Glaciimonas sp. PCH181]